MLSLSVVGATSGYTFAWDLWDRHRATELTIFQACASPELEYLPFSVGYDYRECVTLARDFVRTGGDVTEVGSAVGAWLRQWEGDYDRYQLSEHDCRGGF